MKNKNFPTYYGTCVDQLILQCGLVLALVIILRLLPNYFLFYTLGIIFEAYSPLGNPSLSTNPEPGMLQNAVIAEIAEKHGVTPAQVRRLKEVTLKSATHQHAHVFPL